MAADRVSIGNLMRSATSSSITIKQSKDFFTDQAQNTHDNLVMFITGHGGLNGLDAAPAITPHALLSGIKYSPSLKQAVVYLGQCYAGIFNFVEAGAKSRTNPVTGPDIIFIGATNLHESLSHSTSEMLLTGPQSWPANLFLLFTFKWFLRPMDVDGDGKFTIIDCYKFAGAVSNMANKRLKAESFPQTYHLQQKWESAKHAHEQQPSPTTSANLEAAATLYTKHLEIMYVHQECWILNALPSQRIER